MGHHKLRNWKDLHPSQMVFLNVETRSCQNENKNVTTNLPKFLKKKMAEQQINYIKHGMMEILFF